MASSEENRRRSFVRRAKCRHLLEICSKIEEAAENVTPVQTLKNVVSVVKLADQIHAEEDFHGRIEYNGEIVMDAQIIKGAHEIVGSVVQTMDNSEISEDEFVAAINRTIGPSRDWDKLREKLSFGMSKTITYSQSLFGTFDVDTVLPEKVEKERRKKTTIKNSQQTKPKAVVQKQTQEQEATTVNVIGNQIRQLYENNNLQPLPYYQLIIDPGNFMRTIQNAFQISFLFRDGLVAIEVGQDGYPTVRPVNESEKQADSEGQNYQMVSNLSTTLCDDMIQRYGIREAMITWTACDE